MTIVTARNDATFILQDFFSFKRLVVKRRINSEQNPSKTEKKDVGITRMMLTKNFARKLFIQFFLQKTKSTPAMLNED